MRRISYMIGLILLGFYACQENEKNGFESEGAVYFQLNTGVWSDGRDSVVYSFAGKMSDTATMVLQVNLMGDAVDYERHVRVVVDREKTTAREGVHFAALAESYLLPAGAYSMTIPVVLYNTDPKLEERSFQLALALQPSDDLQLGLTARTTVRVLMSNMLVVPYYWESMYLDDYFGAYSKVKHEYIIREVGMDFPATEEEYSDNWDAWKAYSKYMDNFFYENYPIYDENGMAIEPWL